MAAVRSPLPPPPSSLVVAFLVFIIVAEAAAINDGSTTATSSQFYNGGDDGTDSDNRFLCPSSCSCLDDFVDCSNRGLIGVPTDMPKWVKILDLQHNDLTSLSEDAFVGLVNLEYLDLSNNQFRSLNMSAFQHLPSLKELKVQNNHLTEIPCLGLQSNLTTLSLHHNHIHSISLSALEKYPGLRFLDLNHNKVSEIPAGVFPNSTKLQHLSLISNRIASLENRSLDNLTHLQVLKLSKNKLTKLPKDLFRHLKKLKILELNRNRLQEITGLAFKGLESLEILKLQGNRISSLLDAAFWQLSNIQQLRLDHNNITLVARVWLYGLTSLQQLSLTYNQIAEVEEDGWEFCQRLWELDLSHNHLQVLRQDVFHKLSNLLYLNLDHNNISFIEDGAFKGLSTLETLKLSHNEISWTIEDMMGTFVGLDNLHSLSLASNQIRSVTKHAFKGLYNLQNLNLTDNAITSMQNNAFADMKYLKELRFNTSNLLCDCQLQWLPLTLIASGFRDSVTASCAHPEFIKGKSVFEVKAKDFKCGEDFPKPYFIEEPQTQVALRGDNRTFVCKVASSSDSPVTFQWKRDNNVLSNAIAENFAQSSESDVTAYTTILHLYNVSDRDEGRYQCVISNQFGSAYSQKVKLTVHVFPTFTKTPVDVTVKAGSSARLECAAQGQPPPQIAWQKDGGDDFPAARERRMHVMPSDEVFFIVNVKASDMGMYGCTAQNTAGIIMANFSLTVLEIPSFVRPMEDKETKIGSTAVLECRASGSPKPKLTWTKDGLPLLANERHFFTAEDQLLVIVETQLADEGSYSCEMSNTLGTKRGSSHLSIAAGLMPEESSIVGIIIIAVVCCVVGTSLIWVVIIYKTRKRQDEFLTTAVGASEVTEPLRRHQPTEVDYPTCLATCTDNCKSCTQNLFTDNNSEHSSKDSGTGDSAKRSCDNLVPTDMDYGCRQMSSMPGDQKLTALVVNGGDSLSSLSKERHDSGSSVDTLSSSPSAYLGVGIRTTRGSSDPTFRTFLPRATNHDRMESARSATPSPPPRIGKAAAAVSVGSSSSSGVGSRSNSSAIYKQANQSPNQQQQQQALLRHKQQGGQSGGPFVETSQSFATFPRSVSQWSQRHNTDSPKLGIQPQEVQNDSGSFSIVSEDAGPSAVVDGRGSGSQFQTFTRNPLANHGKCSMPNLTHLESAVTATTGAPVPLSLWTAVDCKTGQRRSPPPPPPCQV